MKTENLHYHSCISPKNICYLLFVICSSSSNWTPCIRTSQPSDLVYTCYNPTVLSSHPTIWSYGSQLTPHNLILRFSSHTQQSDRDTLIRLNWLSAPTCCRLLARSDVLRLARRLTWFIRLGHDVIATWFHRRDCSNFTLARAPTWFLRRHSYCILKR